MKTLALFTLLCLGMAGCQGKINESDFLGTWRVVEFNANTPSLSPQLIAAGRDEAMSSEYRFMKNGDSVLKSNYYVDGKNAHWKYDPSTHQLTINHHSEDEIGPESFIVQSLSDHQTVWVQDLGDLGQLSLTLVRD